MHVSTPLYSVTTEARRGGQIARNWSYRLLLTVVWVLGTEPGSPARAGSDVNL